MARGSSAGHGADRGFRRGRQTLWLVIALAGMTVSILAALWASLT